MNHSGGIAGGAGLTVVENQNAQDDSAIPICGIESFGGDSSSSEVGGAGDGGGFIPALGAARGSRPGEDGSIDGATAPTDVRFSFFPRGATDKVDDVGGSSRRGGGDGGGGGGRKKPNLNQPVELDMPVRQKQKGQGGVNSHLVQRLSVRSSAVWYSFIVYHET